MSPAISVFFFKKKKKMTQSEINSVIGHILKIMHLPQLLGPGIKEEENSIRDNLWWTDHNPIPSLPVQLVGR